ncbi:DUF4838 domain-containing protein [Paenibacillus eucommiae]|uniref:DUF4838 domain-containing protein n=1 Tax=Paenibacillus eucommiae TaxID=1355755 RepID=A0ABS4IMD2_9BACL|nr:DUF4838 domain-containing protein [Paenibacillus eucommiae]MBP1988727.1 hypothetical protein [Paenibacillus eucommiae]
MSRWKEEAKSLQIIDKGSPAATIMIHLNADNQTRNAAAKLAEYVEKSTGAVLPILTDDPATVTNFRFNKEVQIYIGAEGLSAASGQMNILEGMDGDGFVIYQEGTRITIAGPTPWGTEFGVNEFLERYVGVRWLMPGEDWEDVPQLMDLAVSENEYVRQEPAFFSREFDDHTSNSPIREAWTRNNRMHGRVEFKHNLFNLFPPALYKDTHPEYYPPGADLSDIHGWQPCFTAPGIVEEAIHNINTYFDANPEATSYSLGMNDGRNFCEANPEHPSYPNKVNSNGYTDISDIYFDWVNQVSKGVFAKHPDKFLGTLAYLNLYDPPTNVTLDPRVIVYVTDERLSWGDQNLKEAGHALTDRWLQAAPGIAFYEYLFGTPYLVPRPYFNFMAENYKYAKDAGVTVQYSEMVPNYGEGPKPWLAARLQWDPEQDFDALLAEWYERAVGIAAAADLAAYYELWGHFWEKRMFKTEWFADWSQSSPRANYMNFLDDSYLEAVTFTDVAQSRSLLESVVEKAVTPKQKKRAEDLLRAFEYYEACVLSYPREVAIAQPANDPAALELVHFVVEKMRLAEKRQELVEEFVDHPVLQHIYSPYYGYGKTLGGYGRIWTGMTSTEMDVIVAWLRQEDAGEEVHKLLKNLAENDRVITIQRSTRLLLGLAGVGTKQLLFNPSFEVGGASSEIADSWNYWMPDGNLMQRTNAESKTGDHSLMARGIRLGGFYQNISVQPGNHGMYGAYYSPVGSDGDGTIRVQLDLYDEQNNYIDVIKPYLGAKRVKNTAGSWSNIQWVGEIPRGVGKVSVYIVLENFDDDQEVYLDDVQFYCLDM